MNLSKLQEKVKDRERWHAAVHGVVNSHTQVSDWTTKVNMSQMWTVHWKFEALKGLENQNKCFNYAGGVEQRVGLIIYPQNLQKTKTGSDFI